MRMPIVWKEWHEQRWRLAFGTVMLVGLIGSLATAHVLSASEVNTILVCAGAVILPLYGAMGVFAPERTSGTLAFYASKPAKPLAVFMAKWFFGWLNVVVPILAASIFSTSLTLVTNSLPYNDSQAIFIMTKVMIPILCFSTIFYTMTCCFAPSRSSEAFVGLTGLLVLVFMAMYPLAMSHILHDKLGMSLEHPIMQQILFSISPLSIFDSWRYFEKSRQLLPYILCIDQGIIFLLTLSFGYWKWRRHW